MMEETAPLFERIYEHPFLKELRAGTLGNDRLAFYFEQNVHYIDAVLRCRSIVAAKAQNDEIRDFFLRNTKLILDEYYHQEDMLRKLEGTFEAPVAPTLYAYSRHLFYLAFARDPVEYLGSFLPCPLSYDAIGYQLVGAPLTPFQADWWDFYMSDAHHTLCSDYRDFVDRYSQGLSDERRGQMLETFRIGVNYEYMFWDMAYTKERWPLP